MQLWIDGQCLQGVSRVRGIGRYVREFIGALHDFRQDIELSISFNAAMADETVDARELVRQWIPEHRIHVWQGMAEGGEVPHGNSPSRQLSEAALAHHVACLRPDIALSASPFEGMYEGSVPFVKLKGHDTRTAAIFFDAIPYRFRERYLPSHAALAYYERRLRAYESFDLLFAISEFSRAEAMALLPAATVVNVYAGVSPHFLALVDRPLDATIPLGLGIRVPYMLYVGALDWRKNVGLVAEAYQKLPHHTRVSLQFVVAGDNPPDAEQALQSQWAALGLPKDGLCMLGHVHDATLVQLYKQARVVVQPSLMEGFGLTALEAITCGAPVIASRTGALPEVLADEHALFDPTDAADIAQKIESVFADRAFAEVLVANSRRRAGLFTWEKTVGIAADALLALPQPPRADDEGMLHEGAARLAKVRNVTLGHVAQLKVDARYGAIVLACAEPKPAMPRRLLVDVTSTCRVDHATGIQRVVNRIAKELQIDQRAGGATLIYLDSTDGIFEATRDGSGKLVFAGVEGSTGIRVSAADRILMLDSSWEFHEAQRHVLRKARLQGAEVISTLYDLVPITLPGFCNTGMPETFTLWLKAALHYSTGFVCISRAVADQLHALLEAIRFPRRMQIGYWHLGADFTTKSSSTSASQAPSSREPDRPMFLMVGTIEPRKGYGVALEAFEKLWQDGFAGALYIAGKRGWAVETVIERIQKNLEFGKKLHWIEGPDDSQLQLLYEQCDALVAASFYEGFGLPIIEAAKHCKPVIASDIPVFKEVASTVSSALFFETGSSDSLVSAIKAFRQDQALYTARAEAPSQWLTWSDSAKQLEAVVCEGGWYTVYAPSSDGEDEGPEGLGLTAMDRKLGPGERVYDLTLAEDPSLAGGTNRMRVVVKVTNRSDVVWSSEGLPDGSLGIKMGYRLLGTDGHVVQADNTRLRIPFVMVPGDVSYMAIDVDTSGRRSGAALVEINLVQEGVAWWDKPLRLPLPEQSGSERDTNYQLGTTLAFGNDENAEALFVGWSEAESWGVWSNRSTAQIGVNIDPATRGPLNLILDARAFVTEKLPKQTIDVSVGDQSIGSLIYRLSLGNARYTQSLVIPASVVESSKGKLLITLDFKNAASPYSIGLSGDTRKLAVGLIALTIHE